MNFKIGDRVVVVTQLPASTGNKEYPYVPGYTFTINTIEPSQAYEGETDISEEGNYYTLAKYCIHEHVYHTSLMKALRDD